MKNARQVAFEALCKVYYSEAYSNLTLDGLLNESGIAGRDRALASSIAYGTLERTITLDFIISKYLDKPISTVNKEVLVLLRMATYQLVFMDKMPAHAVINETVKMTKSNYVGFASGFVNAVLRYISNYRYNDEYLDDLSIKYSCPQPLINMWTKMYGPELTRGILESLNTVPMPTVRVNTLKIKENEFIRELAYSNIACERTFLENAVDMALVGNIADMQEFQDGLFHIQDLASQLAVCALQPKENEVIFDMCSAPGGKSFTIAEMTHDNSEIYSFDIYEKRLGLIEDGARRLGIKSIKTVKNDASVFNSELPMADRILCDVPCSGLGIIRKKPEIRYKNLDLIKDLPELQYQILETS